MKLAEQIKAIIRARAIDARARAGAWEARGSERMADIKDAQARELDELLAEVEGLKEDGE